MKTIYVGKSNTLASTLVDRLVKEEEEVHIISQFDFIKEIKPTLSYKFYKNASEDTSIGKIFASINPDTVIFAGDFYLKDIWKYNEETNKYLSQLINILNQALINKVKKFIYISSSEVYPNGIQSITEMDEVRPTTYKGILCAQGENIVLGFSKLHNLDTVILRMGNIYGCSINEKEQDFLSNIVESFYLERDFTANDNKIIYPLHIKDCVEAIYRAKAVTPSLIYNVGGVEKYTEGKIADILNANLNYNYIVIRYNGDSISYPIDNFRIKKELEWVGFHKFEIVLSNNEIDLIKTPEELKNEKIKKPELKVLQVSENILVFLFFAFLTTITKSHSVLSNFDLMSIYVIIMALFLGVYQSILSVILASAFYIVYNGLHLWSISIVTNIESLLRIAQYIFMGVVVGYSVDNYRTIIKGNKTEYDYLNREYQEIKKINEDNILIKQEYEKRLLNYKTSLPKLYSIISQLTVLEPVRIFAEAINVIKDIMDTDTVAVYLCKEKSSYIRLINSSSTEAIFHGKSINLNDIPGMRDTLFNNEIFIGSQWNENEPSLAAPIFNGGLCIAVIIIKEMKFSMLTLYQINLFRTLAVLITSSVVKAKAYEDATRSAQYVEDTEILNENEFNKLIEIKEEGKRKGLSDYSIIKLDVKENIKNTYFDSVNFFRNTDFFGINEKGELFVLLSNTSYDEVNFVLDRLKNNEICAELI